MVCPITKYPMTTKGIQIQNTTGTISPPQTSENSGQLIFFGYRQPRHQGVGPHLHSLLKDGRKNPTG